MQQATLAIRARVTLDVLRDTIRPFPIFSEVFVATLKALRGQALAVRAPVEAPATRLPLGLSWSGVRSDFEWI